ncbi:MAG: DotD/TraH family lipoprotein [Alphaproteobacteria bacterium]|nr:DotD/TraH family lipoprotein [Alphaproteobacteria bacterium]
MARFSSPLLLTLAVLLTACSSLEKFSNDTPQIVAAPDAVTAMLADAADRASNALETLAAVEATRTPPPEIAPIGDAPVELRRAVSVNWIGGAEPITKTLADRAGYKFMVVGNAPPVPVIVSLDVENKPVIEILRDIGLQIGMRGDIKVDSSQRLVEIHYPPNTGVGG